MALATLSIDLEARLAKFEQGMDRAGRLLEKLSAGATNTGQRVGEIFAGNLLADAAGQALQRLVTFFPQVAEGVLAIKDLAEATGSSVESISALDDVARRSGDSLQAVEGVLIKFNNALKEADGKNGVSQALKAIGLDAQQLRDLDPAEALQRTAQALNGFADDGNRARLTQELFGKGVKEAATFLRDLAEAGKLNATVTTEQAEEIDKFNKELAGLRTNIVGIARDITNEVVPAINSWLEKIRTADFSKFFNVFKQEINANVITDELARVVAQIEALKATEERQGLTPLLQKKLAGLREEAASLSRQALAATDALKGMVGVPAQQFFNDRRNGGGPNEKRSLPFVGDANKLKDAKNNFEDYQQTLTKGLASLIERTDTVKLAELNNQLDKLAELSAAGLDPKIVEQVQRLLVPPSGPNSGPQLSDEMKRVNELLLQTDSAKLAQASKDAALLREELSKTAPGTARYTQVQDALLDIETTITDLSGTFPAFFDQVDQRLQQTADVVEGTLGSSLRSILDGNFKDIGKMWGNLLLDMVAQAAAANLASAIFGERNAQGNRSGGGLFDLFTTWLSTPSASANGNAFGPSGMYAFAAGGIVDKATPFTFGGGKLGVMGEAGPEGIFPLERRGGKLGIRASGAGQTVVHNVTHLTLSGDPNPATLAAMQAMLAKSNQQLVRGLKNGSVGGG